MTWRKSFKDSTANGDKMVKGGRGHGRRRAVPGVDDHLDATASKPTPASA